MDTASLAEVEEELREVERALVRLEERREGLQRDIVCLRRGQLQKTINVRSGATASQSLIGYRHSFFQSRKFPH